MVQEKAHPPWCFHSRAKQAQKYWFILVPWSVSHLQYLNFYLILVRIVPSLCSPKRRAFSLESYLTGAFQGSSIPCLGYCRWSSNGIPEWSGWSPWCIWLSIVLSCQGVTQGWWDPLLSSTTQTLKLHSWRMYPWYHLPNSNPFTPSCSFLPTKPPACDVFPHQRCLWI